MDLTNQSRQIAPEANDIVADRAYTNKREAFVRLLHELGINVTMDYTITEINHPKFIKVGRKRQLFIISCGTLFSGWLPEHMQTPPEGASLVELTDWYVTRSLFRWAPHQDLPGGGIHVRCPQCAGRVNTTAKTRKPKPTNSDGPFIAIEDEYCCLAHPSLGVELLDSFQRIPYGTPAWKQSYSRRNIIEKSNAMIKDKGALDSGWCRAFGLAAHTIAALALAVVHNLRAPNYRWVHDQERKSGLGGFYQGAPHPCGGVPSGYSQ